MTTHVEDEISRALAAAAREIGRSRNSDEVLHAIAESALHTLPGFNHAGVSTIEKDGRVVTRAATSDLVRELDAAQYRLREGPCYDSLRDAAVVSAPNIRHDQRWPRYVPVAARAGLRSQLAVKLYLDEHDTVGGLNLYSTTTDEIEVGAEVAADLFASQAAAALDRVRELDHLHHALASRETIGTALGLVMGKYEMDSQAAFNFLARASSSSNVKLRLIAERVIELHNREISATRRPTSTRTDGAMLAPQTGTDEPGVVELDDV